MNLFDDITAFKAKRRVLSHMLFWLGVILFYISAGKYSDRDSFLLWLTVAEVVLFTSLQIGAAYFLAYFIIPLFYKRQYLVAFIYFVIGSYIVCALSRYLTIHVGEPMAGVRRKAWETDYEIFTNVWKLIYVYFFQVFSIGFVFLFFKFLFGQIDIQKRTLSLEKAKAETELKLLKTQLNPHFLFNTLNNIYSLSVHNSPNTSESIARLSDILDHILYRCNSINVPLSTEINLLKNYIALEKLRYDERLKVLFTTSVDDDVDIAPLLMLSIVENAFKHGAGQNTDRCVIDIVIRVADNVFTCKVANSFAGADVVGKHKKIGLHNLQQQLELLYPGMHSLAIEQSDGLFIVTLIISLQLKKQAA